MKVLFLDMDGVLVPFRGSNGIDLSLVKQLKRIHDVTNCKIVLSSSWRIFKSSVLLVDQTLVTAGIPLLIGQTPQLGIDRSKEIGIWLRDYEKSRQEKLKPLRLQIERDSVSEELLELTKEEIKEIEEEEITHWVAVDGMPLQHSRSDWGKMMKGHFVHTDCDIGMVEERADLAIKILMGEVRREDVEKQEGSLKALEELEEDYDPGYFEN